MYFCCFSVLCFGILCISTFIIIIIFTLFFQCFIVAMCLLLLCRRSIICWSHLFTKSIRNI
ncbi:pL60L [African swine fever virus]|uniref:PL60L n=1 Tax=African swine fever virus TaxID=10497 RepID=A0A894KTM5_ASF|nr:pL60L [African swine fever virus]